MTEDDFRKIALSLGGATESAHMLHPDFRVRGKIFATLGYPNRDCAVVVLSPEKQKEFVRDHPDVFEPVKGIWGERGNTKVNLPAAQTRETEKALRTAWTHFSSEGSTLNVSKDLRLLSKQTGAARRGDMLKREVKYRIAQKNKNRKRHR
jgi:hypothetical protein